MRYYDNRSIKKYSFYSLYVVQFSSMFAVGLAVALCGPIQ